jgi:oligopeptide transport system substrate-binding protein
MRFLLCLVAAAALLLPSAVQAARAQATPQDLTIGALGGEPDSVDPNRISFSDEALIVRQVFEPLLRFDSDLIPQPAAAESYEISPDGLVYTFHLRADGFWSDGQPVSAQQFEYSWKRILDPKTAAPSSSLFVDAGIVGAEEFNSGHAPSAAGVGLRALDDQTFEIRLSHPFGPLLNLAALPNAVPLRPDLVESNSTGWAQEAPTYVGNGPFMLSEWVHQHHISMVQNPYYVAHLQWPAPTLTYITLPMDSSPAAAYIAYLNGERDWMLVPDPLVHGVESDPELSQQAHQNTQLATDWVHLNNARPPLDNILVRRALSKAIDRSALIRDVANGIGQAATSVIPPGMPGYQEGLGKDLDFDPVAARALLAEAGYPNGRGFPNLVFSFPMSFGNATRSEFLQAQWKQNLNIEIQLEARENKAFQAAFRDKKVDLTLIGWTADYPDPENWFNGLFGCTGSYNVGNYCNRAFDALVSQADNGVVLEDRLKLYNQAQTLLMQDAPVLPLLVGARLVVIKPYVQMIDGSPLLITGSDDYPGDFFLDMVHMLPH